MMLMSSQPEEKQGEEKPLMTKWLAACGMVLLASSTVFAQRVYIDRDYQPPNGEAREAFFARAYPGMPVADRPGFIWGHDGRWYFELASTPTPTPPSDPNPPVPSMPPECIPWPNPYTEAARVLACKAKFGPPAPSVSLVIYQVGVHYKTPYDDARMVVLSVTRGVDETTVITAQWLTATPTYFHPEQQHAVGDVFAFKAGATDAWREVTP